MGSIELAYQNQQEQNQQQQIQFQKINHKMHRTDERVAGTIDHADQELRDDQQAIETVQAMTGEVEDQMFAVGDAAEQEYQRRMGHPSAPGK